MLTGEKVREAINELEKKGAVIDSKTINLKNAKNIGNKSLGRIDLLRRCGYTVIR